MMSPTPISCARHRGSELRNMGQTGIDMQRFASTVSLKESIQANLATFLQPASKDDSNVPPLLECGFDQHRVSGS